MFDSVRNLGRNVSKDLNTSAHQGRLNVTGNFKQTPNDKQNNTDLNNSMTPTPQTGKRTNKSSFISSNQTLDSSEITVNTQTTQYVNVMQEIKERFSEFRTLDNNELELILRLYDSHFSTPHQISNSAYYVSGALIVLVSIQFINAQNFSGYDTSHFGLTPEQDKILTEER